jgi:PEGA domain
VILFLNPHKKALRWGVLALALFATAPARADESDDLMRKGSALRAEGQDAEALRIFEQAYALKPTPSGRAQIALAEQALGLWLKAEADLDAALTFLDDPWIVRQQIPLQDARKTIQQHIGTLELLGGEPGALVIVDGATVGKLPLPSLRLETGKRRLEIRQNGFHPIEREVNVVAANIARETLVMSPLPKGASSSQKATNNAWPVQEAGQAERTVGIGIMLGGGAAAVFGGVSLILREVVSQSYNANPACGIEPLPQECLSQRSQRQTWVTLAIGSFIGAGVLVGAGALLWLTSPSGTASPSRSSGKSRVSPSWRCVPYAGTSEAGLGCTGAF